jgi:Transposase, Mutator family
MTRTITKTDSAQRKADTAPQLFDDWSDPIETEVRDRARQFIEELIRQELDAVLARPRYGRRKPPVDEGAAGVTGHRHGSRARSLTGTFGPVEIEVLRARLNTPEGKTTEWKSKSLRAYQRRTLAADALIASTYLAGTNTRRVRRALAALFGGKVGKDTVSRTWRKVKGDWDAWNARSLADERIVRLILDGTVVRVRLDRKLQRSLTHNATPLPLSLLVDGTPLHRLREIGKSSARIVGKLPNGNPDIFVRRRRGCRGGAAEEVAVAKELRRSNQLLDRLPRSCREDLVPHLRTVDLARDAVLHKPGRHLVPLTFSSTA